MSNLNEEVDMDCEIIIPDFDPENQEFLEALSHLINSKDV